MYSNSWDNSSIIKLLCGLSATCLECFIIHREQIAQADFLNLLPSSPPHFLGWFHAQNPHLEAATLRTAVTTPVI